jgi:signal transduction histidine kinase
MKLYLKLYVAFCFALVLAMLSVGIILYQIDDYFEINNNSNFYNNRIEGIKKVLIYILVNEGFNENNGLASEKSAKLIGDWLDAKIWIFDLDDHLLGANNNDPYLNWEGKKIFKKSDLLLQYQKGIRSARIIIPSLKITIDAQLNKSWNKDEKGIGIAIIVAIGIAFALLLFPLSKLIGRPLDELKKTVTEISKGDLSKRVAIRSKDEIGELGQQFNRMADRIEAMISSYKELNAHVSHELRSPLARMRLGLELIEMNQNILQDEKNQEKISNLKLEILRLEELITGILTLSKSSLITVKLDDLNLTNEILKILEFNQPKILEKGIKIHQEIEIDFNLQLDRNGSISILNNLIENALNYSPERDEILISLTRNGNQFQFSIENSYESYGENFQSWLLPFIRGSEASILNSKDGVGMGLAIAKENAEKMKGNISIVKNGSRITFLWTGNIL